MVFANGGRVLPNDIQDHWGNDGLAENALPEGGEPIWLEDIWVENMFTIMYPFRAHKCAACWESFVTPQALVEHLELRHAEDSLQFRCSECRKSNSSVKGIAIHYGKCIRGQTKQRGPTENELPAADGGEDLPCSECTMKFSTRIGLGQHIRFRHPHIANQKRIDAVREDIHLYTYLIGSYRIRNR